jgi:hypothetical protein
LEKYDPADCSLMNILAVDPGNLVSFLMGMVLFRQRVLLPFRQARQVGGEFSHVLPPLQLQTVTFVLFWIWLFAPVYHQVARKLFRNSRCTPFSGIISLPNGLESYECDSGYGLAFSILGVSISVYSVNHSTYYGALKSGRVPRAEAHR